MSLAAPARYAVVGNPVAHSRSPRIHTLFAAQTGRTLVYERLAAPLDGFIATVTDFFAAGGKGLNVTVPFKLEAYALAARQLSPRARAAGAVNTLWQRNGVLHGCNTDGVGLVADLRRLAAPLDGARVLLVGAGGASRGALGPLLAAGCARVRIANRTEARAVQLLSDWQVQTGEDARLDATGLAGAGIAGGWDLVINATASSLADAAPDLPAQLYASGAHAYDMMYGAAPTPFMHQARADGAEQAHDGLGMLVGQAAESFHIWHGVQPDPLPVLAALREDLARPVETSA